MTEGYLSHKQQSVVKTIYSQWFFRNKYKKENQKLDKIAEKKSTRSVVITRRNGTDIKRIEKVKEKDGEYHINISRSG